MIRLRTNKVVQGILYSDMALNLDDRSVVTELDPQGMFKLTEDFPKQCREALTLAEGVKLQPLDRRPGLVIVTGMGGSASGGDFVKALFDREGSVPLVVNRDYGLPEYTGVGDLVFCMSYSGGTEETLSSYEAAKKAGAKIIAVTSGGKLATQAGADGYPVYKVPGGQPPRTALGYMLIPVIVACQKLKLIRDQDFPGVIALLEDAAKELTVEAGGNPAKMLARRLHGALPIIYGLGSWQGLIANRWRCQINENSKQLTFYNTYPELDHNEILGWVGAAKLGVSKYAGVVLEDGAESEKMQARASITERMVADVCAFDHVRARGDTLLKKMLSLAYFGDYVSLYLARLNAVDPGNMDSIIQLKDELAKIK